MLAVVLLGAAAIAVSAPVATAAEVIEDAGADPEAILPDSAAGVDGPRAAVVPARVARPRVIDAASPPIPPPER